MNETPKIYRAEPTDEERAAFEKSRIIRHLDFLRHTNAGKNSSFPDFENWKTREVAKAKEELKTLDPNFDIEKLETMSDDEFYSLIRYWEHPPFTK